MATRGIAAWLLIATATLSAQSAAPAKPGAEHQRLGAFVGGTVTHDWILCAIGANRYHFTRRQPGELVPYLR